MSQEEMLKVMAEENPNINFLTEAFGAVPEDSS